MSNKKKKKNKNKKHNNNNNNNKNNKKSTKSLPKPVNDSIAIPESESDNVWCCNVKKRYILILGLYIGVLLIVILDWNTKKIVKKNIDKVQKNIYTGTLSLNNTIYDMIDKISLSQDPSVGINAYEEGFRTKHPIVLIPGFITTGLELWQGEQCAKKYFRQRLWGHMSMLYNMISNADCWRRHIQLDHLTGLDPDDIKLRAATGLEAADYFLGDVWVWGRLIEASAALGYDHKTIKMASYDWRIGFQNLEKRDGYFTDLKSKIEVMKEINHEKVVLITHSYGSQVGFYFLKWVESNQGGKGGKEWVEKYIHTYINIGGALLGASKSVSALVSGEMKDTAQLGQIGDLLTSMSAYSIDKRTALFRTWTSIINMMPKGGSKIWQPLKIFQGQDENNGKQESDNSVYFSHNGSTDFINIINSLENDTKLLSIDDVVSKLSTVEGNLGRSLRDDHSFDYFEKFDKEDAFYDQNKFWTNPLTMQLPKAPSMRIYCMYGTNLPTERQYFYTKKPIVGERNALEEDEKAGNFSFQIDTSVNSKENNITAGVGMGDGDGTVNLVSLGYPCRKLWGRGKTEHNPSGIQTITKEYLHNNKFLSKIYINPQEQMRKGDSGDHVDIMGNKEMLYDILRIISGNDIESFRVNEIHSKIDEVIANL